LPSSIDEGLQFISVYNTIRDAAGDSGCQDHDRRSHTQLLAVLFI